MSNSQNIWNINPNKYNWKLYIYILLFCVFTSVLYIIYYSYIYDSLDSGEIREFITFFAEVIYESYHILIILLVCVLMINVRSLKLELTKVSKKIESLETKSNIKTSIHNDI